MARQTPQWLHAGSYDGIADRQLITALWPAGGASGCAVTPSTGMALAIAPGHVAVPAPDGSTVLCNSTGTENVTLDPAPPSGTDRVDLVVATATSAEWGGASESWIFAVVKGAQGAPPGVAPSVPPGSLAVAQIHVAGGAAAIAAGDITDRRWSLIGGPYTAAYCNAAYVNANSAYQRLNLDATEEGGGFWDVPNKQFVVPVAGRYLITAEAQPDRALAFAYLQIKKNGGIVRTGPNANQPTTGTFSNSSAGIASVVRAAAGDRLEVGSVTGGACNVLAGPSVTYAQFTYQGP